MFMFVLLEDTALGFGLGQLIKMPNKIKVIIQESLSLKCSSYKSWRKSDFVV